MNLIKLPNNRLIKIEIDVALNGFVVTAVYNNVDRKIEIANNFSEVSRIITELLKKKD